MADKDVLAEEKSAFEAAYDAESENRNVALESLRFSRLGEQWPEKIKKQREDENRPVLTINKMPAFIRQVVNDSRMNRPQIKVKGVDDNSDPETANVFEGCIRNIEYVSKADIAYDTAVDCAASMGWGYIRIGIDYEYDDSFDKGLRIQRVGNPFSVYGDPYSTEADSSDWNQAHVVEYLKKTEFQRRYKGAKAVDWDATGYNKLQTPWRDDDEILICEAWKREKVKRKIYLLSNGKVIGEQEFAVAQPFLSSLNISVMNERDADSYKITQRIMTGAEVLEENEWAGRYIPVIPVYGEEINIEGKRYFRSLVHHAMDAQRMFNYWRSNATEMVALAPRVPFIGEEGAFDSDPNWETANTASHPYLFHKKGTQPPQRQPMDSGQAIGSMAEAMAANDDMKAIIGMYDASLGNRSNETSGVAINARKIEGDTSTFHFIDNLSRAIRHTGCCLIDLIPKVYGPQKILRILGEDQKEKIVKLSGATPQINTPQAPQMPQDAAHEQGEGEGPGGEEERIYDLSVGRYDVAVTTGPGFTTKREQAAAQMTEFVRAYPAAAPIIGDILVKAMDWPQADEIADRIKAMMPDQAKGGMPPELQQMIEEGKKHIQEQDQKIQEQSQQINKLSLDVQAAKIDVQKKDVENAALKLEKGLVQQQHGIALSQAQSMAQQPQQSPVSVNVPDNLGQSLAQAIAPAVTEAVVSAVQHLPPIKVDMPAPVRMRRVPIRDQNGLITHTDEFPIPPEVLN
jgi:hypothetical protein